MTFESEGLLIVAIYIWLPPASYVVFSDNSGCKCLHLEILTERPRVCFATLRAFLYRDASHI